MINRLEITQMVVNGFNIQFQSGGPEFPEDYTLIQTWGNGYHYTIVVKDGESVGNYRAKYRLWRLPIVEQEQPDGTWKRIG